MRIAIFTECYLPFINGVVTHIETLREQLIAMEHEVLIVTASTKLKPPQEENGVLYCTAIPFKKLYGYGVSNPYSLAVFLKMREFSPDVIHVHTEFSIGHLGIHAAKLLNVPLVYTLHTMYNDYLHYIAPKRIVPLVKPAAYFYLKNVASKATEITGPSPKVVELLRLSGVNKQVNVIRNSMKKSDFFPENNDKEKVAQVREKLGLAPDEFGLIYVGRLGGEKSIDELIDNFDFACADKPAYKLIIIGHGPLAQQLKAHASRKLSADRIFFIGRVPHSEIQYYYLACDLFVNASISETNSISMLEAMAAGLFAVQKLDRLDADQVTKGVTGDLFETKEEFASIINRYDRLTCDQRVSMRNTVSMTSRMYDEKAFCQQVLSVYTRAIFRYKRQRKFILPTIEIKRKSER